MSMTPIPTVPFDPAKHVVSCRETEQGRQVYVTLQSMMAAEDKIDAAEPSAPPPIDPNIMAVLADATAAIVALKKQIADLEARLGDEPEPGAILYRDDPEPITFHYDGNDYRLTQDSYARIVGYMAQATAALSEGIQGGDYRWHGGASEFTWPAADGTPVALDAQQMIDLGKVANAHFAT